MFENLVNQEAGKLLCADIKHNRLLLWKLPAFFPVTKSLRGNGFVPVLPVCSINL